MITYVPSIDHADSKVAYGPNTVVVVEEWATIEDLKAHGVAPHMVAFAKNIDDFSTNKAINVLQPTL